MQVYDLVMLSILLIATVFGAWKGMAWQVASLASIVASYFVSCEFREPVSRMIKAEPPWNLFMAMFLLYIGTYFIIWVIFRFISEFIDRVKMKDFDRHAGAILGFAKGVVFCIIVTLFSVTLLESHRQSILDSKSGYYIAWLLDRAHTVMPDELHQVLHPYLHRIDGQLGGSEPPDGLHHFDQGSSPAIANDGILPPAVFPFR